MSKKRNSSTADRPKSPLSRDLKIKPKTLGQEETLRCIIENDISIIYGPPGTGKTHISVAYGLQQFLDGKYKKIILTRPCVEAYGESLGFLPGDFNDKISPYMRPVFDILTMFLDIEELKKYIEYGLISTLPLAYMRGVTFSDAYVVGDEFQNTVPQQVKMFLTRMGHNSKIVLTGDPYQTDIPQSNNGLIDAVERLSGIDGVGIVEMTRGDIVRNKLVDIIDRRYSVMTD